MAKGWLTMAKRPHKPNIVRNDYERKPIGTPDDYHFNDYVNRKERRLQAKRMKILPQWGEYNERTTGDNKQTIRNKK